MRRAVLWFASALALAGCHDPVVLTPDSRIPDEKRAFWHDLDHDLKTWERLQDEGRGPAAVAQGRRIGGIVLANRPAVVDALTNDAHGWRPIAAAAVGFSNDETFNGPLERCLAARDPRVVANALTSLGHLRYRYLDPLRLAAFFKREDASIRVGSAFAIGRTMTASADEEVLFALVLATTDPVARVRLAAVVALGDLAEPAGVRATGDRLHGDPVPRVRLAAADALGRIGGDGAIGTLLGALDRETDEAVREAIYAALARATGLALGRDDARWWDWWNRRLGALAPGRAPAAGTHEGKADPILGRLESADEMAVVVALDDLRVRGRAGDASRAAGALARPEPVLRLAALQTAWDLDGPAALEIYEASLTDPSEKVRRVAAERTLAAGSPAGIPVLIDALESPEALVRVHASRRLARWTGLDHGFLPEGNEASRRIGVDRWRAWWKENETLFRPVR